MFSERLVARIGNRVLAVIYLDGKYARVFRLQSCSLGEYFQILSLIVDKGYRYIS